ncbi:MAG: hypothetical protein KDD55_10755, partial [Bdellovibrionales bacterium]|nr:hypothetical protein [Bdellovibrionales bacterium]
MSEAKETYTIGERSSPFLGITASISAAGILLYSLVNYSLWGSFWLDETISYWITNNSFHDVTQRAISHQGQSPLYFWILWAWRQAIGHNEFALRLPSLLFGLASLAVLWNL